jgi:hypothetical protein
VANTIIESFEQVSSFLTELKQALRSDEFDCISDLDVLINKKTDSENVGYTTKETMAELAYNKKDIYNELLSLTEQDYHNTVVDDIDMSLPKFYAFGKLIQNKEVYIKVKIRSRVNRKIFCVSFHFAKFFVSKPYSK